LPHIPTRLTDINASFQKEEFAVSLWKRGNVYWTYVYVNGKRHCRSTGTGNRRKAEIRDLEFKQELEKKRLRPAGLNPEMLFSELVTRFVTAGNASAYHLDRLKNLLGYFGQTKLFEITKGKANEYRLARQSEKRKIKDATINRDLSVLRHLLYWAVDSGILEANPLSRLRMTRERRTKKSVVGISEELALLVAATPRVREMIITALDTGMRRGEILNQRWEDIDLERKLLFVTKSKTPEGECREIPLTSRLFSMLQDKKHTDGIIFSFQDDVVFSIKTTWRTTLKKAGIRHVRFHDLRHTFNTRLMEAGVMQEVRKTLMGHSGGDEINSIYTHVELPTKRQAIAKLEEWVNQRIQEQAKGGEHSNGTEEQGSVSSGVVELLPEGIDRSPKPNGTEP
jgi:integrase